VLAVGSSVSCRVQCLGHVNTETKVEELIRSDTETQMTSLETTYSVGASYYPLQRFRPAV